MRTMPHGFSRSIKLTRLLFRFISKKLFLLIMKNVFIMPRWYGVWNRVMKKRSIPGFKTMLGGFKGDYNLMSDAPELYPEFEEMPPYYGFCGPLLPDMNIKMPASMKKFRKKKNRPVVFLSMGSSGDPEIFKKIIYSFKGRPYDVFAAATTIIKRDELAFVPDNVIIEDFFPAIELTGLSDVAVIHGGQGTVYTTILGGAPFVGVPMFNEQQWNLEIAARNGCGIIIPRPKFDAENVQKAIAEILANSDYKKNMADLQEKIKKYAAGSKFYPPKTAVEKITDFLDNKRESYFDNNEY